MQLRQNSHAKVIAAAWVCPWQWLMRCGCTAKISSAYSGGKHASFFASLHPRPPQLASVIIYITRPFISCFNCTHHIFFPFASASAQVNPVKIQFSQCNWIHYHFNNSERWESSCCGYKGENKNWKNIHRQRAERCERCEREEERRPKMGKIRLWVSKQRI